MRQEDRNAFLDTLRLVVSFFVILLHVPLPGTIGELLKPVLRCAVPFFFMVSGYVLYSNDINHIQKRLQKQSRRIALLLAGSCAAFFMMHIGYSVWIPHTSFAAAMPLRSVPNIQAVLSFLFFNNTDWFWPGGSAHLWFLAALLYVLLFLRLMLAAVPLRRLYPLIPLLLTAAVPLAIWASRNVWDVQERDMLTRNFLFTGIPCVLAGIWLRQKEQALERLPGWAVVSLPFFCAALCLLERFTPLSNPFGLARILFAGSLVLLGAHFPSFGAKTFLPRFGARYSLVIYIIHYPITTALKWFTGKHGGLPNALIVFAMSLGAAMVWDSIIRLRIQHEKETSEKDKKNAKESPQSAENPGV